MDFELLAEKLFPRVTMTPAEYEATLPQRQLPPEAKVTRFAPSPTGFVHFGGLFPVTVSERLAHQSGGVFYLRIEDTDAKREVEGAAQGLIDTLARYQIHFDEGAVIGKDGEIRDSGAYGPYRQSLRGDIYAIYAKDLMRKGKAYPCFTTEEELKEALSVDIKAQRAETDWAQQMQQQKEQQQKMRALTTEQALQQIEAGHPFVLRILADGDPEKRIVFTDLVRGKIEIPENDTDFVLLKSNGIPTYHFAHAVDDHLMGTTHVVRGEEWLPSLAMHLQLFRYLGFRAPKYLHIAQLMRRGEDGSKKKLSKRDMGANLNDYDRMGYAPECVREYVMTLLNSNFEEWHAQNPEKSTDDFPFSIKKMSPSGCLFDFQKLDDVSRNVLSRMSADEVYARAADWAKRHDPEFAALLTRDSAYAKSILAIGRGGKKPRKDYAVFGELKEYMLFFYDELFDKIEPEAYEARFSTEDIKAALSRFAESYDEADDMNTWFEKIKTIATELGYAADMKAYKAAPEQYKGNVADISMFLRVAVTGRHNAPDLYTVIHILGKGRTLARLDRKIRSL